MVGYRFKCFIWFLIILLRYRKYVIILIFIFFLFIVIGLDVLRSNFIKVEVYIFIFYVEEIGLCRINII